MLFKQILYYYEAIFSDLIFYCFLIVVGFKFIVSFYCLFCRAF